MCLKIIFLIVIGLIAKSTSIPTGNQTINNPTNYYQLEAGNRIIVPLNLTLIKNKLGLESNIGLSIERKEAEHSLPLVEYIEEDGMGYLITNIDHPSKFTIEFNYLIKNKLILKDNFDYTIFKLPSNFNILNVRPVKMVFENLKLSDFLKKEQELAKFFGGKLGNGKTLILDITRNGNDLKVSLGVDAHLSKATKVFIEEACPLNKTELTDELTDNIGLPLKSCSIEQSKNSLVPSNYSSNKLTIDFAITSGSTQFNISSILLIMVFLQIFLSKK